MKRLSFCLLLLAGCGPIDTMIPSDPTTGGQTGEESFGCTTQSRTVLALDETATNGVSVNAAMMQMDSISERPIEWDDGTETRMTATFSNPRQAAYVDYDPGSDSEFASDLECLDQVEFIVDYVIKTDDGRIDMTGETVIQAPDAMSITTLVLFQNGSNRGTFEVPPEMGFAYIELRWGVSSTGEFSGTQETVTDGVAVAEPVVFATW